MANRSSDNIYVIFGNRQYIESEGVRDLGFCTLSVVDGKLGFITGDFWTQNVYFSQLINPDFTLRSSMVMRV